MLYRTDKEKEFVFWWGKFLNGNRKLYFNVIIFSSLNEFSKWFKIVSLGTSRENLTKLWIYIQKKRTWRLPLASSFLIFCAYAKFFAKEHVHWGKKYKESTSDTQEKSNSMWLFFPPKAHRLKARTLAWWKPAFNVFKFTHWVAKCWHTVIFCFKCRFSTAE